MKMRWIILSAAGVIVIACWMAMGIGFFVRPEQPVWIALVTAAALSLEGFFWAAAGVLGWSFLAGRRRMLGRLRDRVFGARGNEPRA